LAPATVELLFDPEAAALDLAAPAPVVVAEAAPPLAPAEPEAAAEVEPPMGAVDCPSIWDWTAALNVPVMPAIVNLAEKARAGYWGLVASISPRDWNRMKYSLALGPIVASGVKLMLDDCDTSVEGEMVCREVCCCELPA